MQTSGSVQQLPGVQGAANSTLSGVNQLYGNNVPQQLMPQYQAATSSITNNPYADAAQQGAGVAGGMATDAANSAAGGGQGLSAFGSQLLQYAPQIAQAAFDPQNALYARTQQQLTDQVRAGEAARGIAMSPYGAGVENNALSNFNIDWQNNALNRANTGVGALSTLGGAAGNALSGGLNLGQGASSLYGTGSSLPYTTANTIGQNKIGALDSLSGAGNAANTQSQQAISDWLNYLGQGNAANQTGIAQQAQNNAWLDDLGNIAGGAAAFFGL